MKGNGRERGRCLAGALLMCRQAGLLWLGCPGPLSWALPLELSHPHPFDFIDWGETTACVAGEVQPTLPELSREPRGPCVPLTGPVPSLPSQAVSTEGAGGELACQAPHTPGDRGELWRSRYGSRLAAGVHGSIGEQEL